MAKILYGVAGEGFGHSSRSHLTAQKLDQAGHEVLFAASNKSYKYLSNYFPDQVSKIHGLTFHYSNARVSLGKTFLTNLAALPEMIKINHKAFTKTYPDFAPDVVITDFEPFTSFWAYMNKVPCLSVDHEHLLCKCDYEKPKTALLARLSSESVTKNYLTGVNSHIVLNFFEAKPHNDKVKITGPVIREKLLDYKPSNDGDFIIFYATSETCLKKFLELSKLFPRQKFHLYGFTKVDGHKNCVFKEHNAEEFIYDLSRCRGVIATGGFSLISECLHFRKKMFIKPIDMQIEQIVNAYHMAKIGGGMYVNNFNEVSLQSFIDWLDEPYYINQKQVLMPDNERYFSVLSDTLEQLTNFEVSIKGYDWQKPDFEKELTIA
ncbi:MAG: glycosyltransferase family protein [Sedimentisphaeraceae bacterium JB056]